MPVSPSPRDAGIGEGHTSPIPTSAMRLSVKERMVLLLVLPREGSLSRLKIIRDLEADLGFSDDEYTRLEFEKPDHGAVRWNPAKDDGKDIVFSEARLHLIREGVAKRDKEGKLELDWLPVVERFYNGTEHGNDNHSG